MIYEQVIADLEQKRATIETVILSLRKHSGAHSELVAALEGEFHGMPLPKAAKIVLTRFGRPMRNKEIWHQLVLGGVTSSSAAPINTLNTILLRRANEVGDIRRVGRGVWALEE